MDGFKKFPEDGFRNSGIRDDTRKFAVAFKKICSPGAFSEEHKDHFVYQFENIPKVLKVPNGTGHSFYYKETDLLLWEQLSTKYISEANDEKTDEPKEVCNFVRTGFVPPMAPILPKSAWVVNDQEMLLELAGLKDGQSPSFSVDELNFVASSIFALHDPFLMHYVDSFFGTDGCTLTNEILSNAYKKKSQEESGYKTLPGADVKDEYDGLAVGSYQLSKSGVEEVVPFLQKFVAVTEAILGALSGSQISCVPLWGSFVVYKDGRVVLLVAVGEADSSSCDRYHDESQKSMASLFAEIIESGFGSVYSEKDERQKDLLYCSEAGTNPQSLKFDFRAQDYEKFGDASYVRGAVEEATELGRSDVEAAQKQYSMHDYRNIKIVQKAATQVPHNDSSSGTSANPFSELLFVINLSDESIPCTQISLAPFCDGRRRFVYRPWAVVSGKETPSRFPNPFGPHLVPNDIPSGGVFVSFPHVVHRAP